MSKDVVIRAEGIGKRYVLGSSEPRERYVALRDVIANKARALLRPNSSREPPTPSREDEFWALRNVDFEVQRGEVVGIIGRNGAGKSTLLKILSRITEPTEGRVTIRGRVASLLEVGTGFHPELTGRENIYLNGSVLGMTRAEIRARFDEIVAFAEVERFLDTPVKRYSSGMYVRLAFAVAAHLEPEILIVDEVLAVGDAEFQKKCLGKMKDVAGGGRTVLFVSHNMAAMQQLCTTGCVLDKGMTVSRSNIADAITRYLSMSSSTSTTGLRDRKDRHGDGRLRITGLTLHNEAGEEITSAICGLPVRFRLHYESQFQSEPHEIDVAFDIRNVGGLRLSCFANRVAGIDKAHLQPIGYFECTWPKVSLRSGRYYSTVFAEIDGITSDWIESAVEFEIEDGDFHGTGRLLPRDHGDVELEQSWRMSHVKSTELI